MWIMEDVKNVVFKTLPFVSSFVPWLVSFVAKIMDKLQINLAVLKLNTSR